MDINFVSPHEGINYENLESGFGRKQRAEGGYLKALHPFYNI